VPKECHDVTKIFCQDRKEIPDCTKPKTTCKEVIKDCHEPKKALCHDKKEIKVDCTKPKNKVDKCAPVIRAPDCWENDGKKKC